MLYADGSRRFTEEIQTNYRRETEKITQKTLKIAVFSVKLLKLRVSVTIPVKTPITSQIKPNKHTLRAYQHHTNHIRTIKQPKYREIIEER